MRMEKRKEISMTKKEAVAELERALPAAVEYDDLWKGTRRQQSLRRQHKGSRRQWDFV